MANPEFGAGSKNAIKRGDAVRIKTRYLAGSQTTPTTPAFAKKTQAGGRQTTGKGTGRPGNKRVLFHGMKRMTGTGSNSPESIKKYGTKSEKQKLRRQAKRASRGMAKGKAMV